MDRRKEFKCGCLILTLLSLVVLVQPDVIPALPPEPDCDSLPNCYGSIPALHNAIVRILANNQEYGSGIHSLHKLYNQLHKDFVNMKDQINSLEKKFVLEKLKQTNNKQTTRVPQPTLKPLPEPELQVHGHVDYTVAGSLEEVLKDNHIWTSDEFNSFQTLFINMTTNLRAQNHKTSKLLKRVNNYRKDVKKYAHLARRFDKKLLHFVDKGSFEESFRKQKSINSLLESRLSQLERLLNRPDVAFQMDGTHKRSHSHQGQFTLDQKDYSCVLVNWKSSGPLWGSSVRSDNPTIAYLGTLEPPKCFHGLHAILRCLGSMPATSSSVFVLVSCVCNPSCSLPVHKINSPHIESSKQRTIRNETWWHNVQS